LQMLCNAKLILEKASVKVVSERVARATLFSWNLPWVLRGP